MTTHGDDDHHQQQQPAPALEGARLSLYAALNPSPPQEQIPEQVDAALAEHGKQLSAIAAAAAQLPHEIRMGGDAAAQFRSYAESLGRGPLGVPTDDLGGLPWALATPVRVVDAYPPNLWVMVDRDGMALSAGVLHRPDDGAQ